MCEVGCPRSEMFPRLSFKRTWHQALVRPLLPLEVPSDSFVRRLFNSSSGTSTSACTTKKQPVSKKCIMLQPNVFLSCWTLCCGVARSYHVIYSKNFHFMIQLNIHFASNGLTLPNCIEALQNILQTRDSPRTIQPTVSVVVRKWRRVSLFSTRKKRCEWSERLVVESRCCDIFRLVVITQATSKFFHWHYRHDSKEKLRSSN